MSKTEHTPGPWRAHELHETPTCRAGFEIHYSIDGECVTDFVYEKADALLIAAAPDLLAALQSIENDDESIPATIWAMRNTAILKATR